MTSDEVIHFIVGRAVLLACAPRIVADISPRFVPLTCGLSPSVPSLPSPRSSSTPSASAHAILDVHVQYVHEPTLGRTTPSRPTATSPCHRPARQRRRLACPPSFLPSALARFRHPLQVYPRTSRGQPGPCAAPRGVWAAVACPRTRLKVRHGPSSKFAPFRRWPWAVGAACGSPATRSKLILLGTLG